MSKLGEVYGELLDETFNALGQHMNRRMMAHAKAIEKLAGKEPGVDELQELFAQGWVPVAGAAVQVTIGGSFAASATRETTIGAEGKVAVGPIQIGGTLTNRQNSAEQTNVQVSTVLQVVEVSEMYGRMLANFSGLTRGGS